MPAIPALPSTTLREPPRELEQLRSDSLGIAGSLVHGIDSLLPSVSAAFGLQNLQVGYHSVDIDALDTLTSTGHRTKQVVDAAQVIMGLVELARGGLGGDCRLGRLR